MVVFPAFEADPPVGVDQSTARAANPVDVANTGVLYIRGRHDSHGGFADGRAREHEALFVVISPSFPMGCLLLEIVVANVGIV